MGTYQLIGAEVSLYSGKARGYLRYKAIPFEEVLATAEVYQKIIVPRTGVRYIPVIISDDDVAVQDTTAIIDFCEERFPEPSVYPAGPLQKLAALLFEIYGDEWLVIPAMHYRWNREENRRLAFEEFGRTAFPGLPEEKSRQMGEMIGKPFSGALPYLGITKETEAGIEASYEAFLADFEAHLAGLPFLLGTRPSIGDFGLVAPLYAHLYRDPASGRLMKEKAPRVAEWVERMVRPAPRAGEFLTGDEVPETLFPMLRRMFEEHLPIYVDTARRFAEWTAANEGKEVPRAIGVHEFVVGGCKGTRSIFPYTLWMWQRAVDHHRSLTGEAKEKADRGLKDLGGYEGLTAPLTRRVKRANNLIVPE